MTVHIGLPLTGRFAPAGRDLLRGMELALERRPVEAIVHDTEGRAAEVARTAADDPGALAFLGDMRSHDVRAMAPVLGEAGLLEIAPVATWSGLGGPTLVRLSPNDRACAAAIADWLAGAGVRELLLAHDHDGGYGVPVGEMCATAARERGVTVRSRPVWDHDEDMAPDVAGVQAFLYVGAAGSGAVGLWNGLAELDPDLWLLGSDGVAVEWLAAALTPAAAERTRFWVAQRAPMALYGYEAMALALDAIDAGGDRAGVVRAARAARDRVSVIGRYSLDAGGLTTDPRYGRLVVEGGRLVWDTGDGRAAA